LRDFSSDPDELGGAVKIDGGDMFVADRNFPIAGSKRGDGRYSQVRDADRGRKPSPFERVSAVISRNIRARIYQVKRLRHAAPSITSV
jgi:hypothetical protein